MMAPSRRHRPSGLYNKLLFCRLWLLKYLKYLLRWGQPTSDRDHIKTHKSYDIGAHFGHKIGKKYQDLRWFKKVLVVIKAIKTTVAKSSGFEGQIELPLFNLKYRK